MLPYIQIHDLARATGRIGMAAMIAATTHAPLIAAAMVFELSGDYAIVLPLLVATATATLLSKRLRPDSVYGAELRRKGMACVSAHTATLFATFVGCLAAPKACARL